MKRNEEVVACEFEIGNDGFRNGLNVDFNERGQITKRKGYATFGEMVHVLWDINKRAKKMGFTGEYTIRLPLKGTKPIYKKTVKST